MPTTRRISQLPYHPATGRKITTLPRTQGQTAAIHTLPMPKPAIPPPADRTIAMPSAPTGGSWATGVLRAAREAGVPGDLALAIALEESGGNPRAVGDAGTSHGLFQLHQGGALGHMSVAEAQDPYRNAMAVLPSWARLGPIPSDPRAALYQYYSRVGRGSSNEIPTTRALGLLPQARQLYKQYGGSSGAPSPGLPGSPPGGGGGVPTAPAPPAIDLSALRQYLESSRAAVTAGRTPPNVFSLLGAQMPALRPVQAWLNRSHADVEAGRTPQGPPIASLLAALAVQQQAQAPTDPTAVHPRQGGAIPGPIAGVDYPLGATGKLIGTPYSGTHTLGNWESDKAVDIAVPVGTPVVAPADGVIGSQIGALGSNNPRMAGLRVHLDGPADSFYFAHLSKLNVRPGQRVRAGQIIGWSGAANGVAHLHFASEHRDPRAYVGGTT